MRNGNGGDQGIRAARASMPAGVAQMAGKTPGPSVRSIGLGGLTVLSISFWLIFYQNLPASLDGMASHDPVVLANITDRIMKIFMIGVAVYFMATRWDMTRSVASKSNVGAVACLALALLSAAWSFDPSATTLRFISLAAIYLLCFAACAAGWHRRRFQQMALPPMMLLLLASLAVGIVLPNRITEIGTDVSQMNAWHGITHSKNEFGMLSSMATIICFNRCLAREGRTLWALAGSIIAFTCLVLSRSNTSMFATMVGVLAMVLLMRVPPIRKKYFTYVVIGFASMIVLYELVIQNVLPGVNTLLAPIVQLTGKDTTFSARTYIWDVVKAHIQGAPYLGTGYGAYWLGPYPSSPSYSFVPMMNFYPTEAHNGYLDIVNDLGYVGLACLLAFLFFYLRQSLRLMRFDPNQSALYLAILFQEMVINMSESEWLSRSDTFAVLILASICLSRSLLDVRQPSRATVVIQKANSRRPIDAAAVSRVRS